MAQPQKGARQPTRVYMTPLNNSAECVYGSSLPFAPLTLNNPQRLRVHSRLDHDRARHSRAGRESRNDFIWLRTSSERGPQGRTRAELASTNLRYLNDTSWIPAFAGMTSEVFAPGRSAPKGYCGYHRGCFVLGKGSRAMANPYQPPANLFGVPASGTVLPAGGHEG